MKYLLSLIQILLCCFLSICLTAFIMIAVSSVVFTKDNMIKYMKNNKYLISQKTKLQSDLQSVSLANNLNYTIFNGYITDKIIISNNEDYINNIFNTIGGLKNKTIYSNAADEYAKGIKNILISFKAKTDPKIYNMPEAGIDAFVNLQRTTFIKSAAPVTGFETFAVYLNKLYKLTYFFLAATLIGAFLLLLLNMKRQIISVSYILYFVCASGILTSAISGFILWIITTKNTILNSSYLKEIADILFKNALILGIIVFIVTQVILILILSKNKQKKAINVVQQNW